MRFPHMKGTQFNDYDWWKQGHKPNFAYKVCFFGGGGFQKSPKMILNAPSVRMGLGAPLTNMVCTKVNGKTPMRCGNDKSCEIHVMGVCGTYQFWYTTTWYTICTQYLLLYMVNVLELRLNGKDIPTNECNKHIHVIHAIGMMDCSLTIFPYDLGLK